MNEQIREKIKNLLLKASNHASTENEALAAMQAAKKLMTKHNVTENEVNKSEIIEDKITLKGRQKEAADLICDAIAEYTGTYALIATIHQFKRTFIYVGRPHEVEFAIYLTSMLTSVIDRWAAEYEPQDTAYNKDFASLYEKFPELKDDEYFYKNYIAKYDSKEGRKKRAWERTKKRREYAKGIASTVSTRLFDLCAEEDERDNNDALNEYYDAMDIGVARTRRSYVMPPADYFAGKREGEKINLNRPIKDGDKRNSIKLIE